MRPSRTKPVTSSPRSRPARRPRLLLVDFENIQPTDLAGLPEDLNVVIFVGANQKNIPLPLVASAQQLGSRVEWQKVAGEGRNALDFFIACHLGRVFERTPNTECFVLSRDKGFDPLLRQLNAAGLTCRRITSCSEIGMKSPAKNTAKTELRTIARSTNLLADARYQRALEVLRNLEPRSRPRNRKRLAQVIAAVFQKKIGEKEVNRIIESLLAAGLVAETDSRIEYRL